VLCACVAQLFFADFAAAFQKLEELGTTGLAPSDVTRTYGNEGRLAFVAGHHQASMLRGLGLEQAQRACFDFPNA
jgi:hypothetical protein